jgi:hypothetical protein
MNETSTQGVCSQNRLGTTFHRTFSINRPSISEILRTINASPGEESHIDDQVLRNLTHLGTIYIESMPRYSFGSGLIDNENKITPFGKSVKKIDPLLELTHTQWLMHYYLSAPYGPGPLFWHELVTQRFRSGDLITTDDIATQIAEIYQRDEGKPLAKRSARSTATIFLGAYTKSDGLGSLGIIKKIGDSEYQILEPSHPPLWTIACALVSFWQIKYPDMATMHLNNIINEGFFTSIFMISQGSFNSTLETLQREGVLEVFRVAPPYQVALLHRDLDFYLERMYGNSTDR